MGALQAGKMRQGKRTRNSPQFEPSGIHHRLGCRSAIISMA
jgi:hypothetical protein